jgi:hypothetical protein
MPAHLASCPFRELKCTHCDHKTNNIDNFKQHLLDAHINDIVKIFSTPVQQQPPPQGGGNAAKEQP